MAHGKPVKIMEVLYHDHNNPHGGAAGDGSAIKRFNATKAGKAEAAAFAKGRDYFGTPAEPKEATVSRSAARRYGLA
jgi:hypothetical protein